MIWFSLVAKYFITSNGRSLFYCLSYPTKLYAGRLCGLLLLLRIGRAGSGGVIAGILRGDLPLLRIAPGLFLFLSRSSALLPLLLALLLFTLRTLLRSALCLSLRFSALSLFRLFLFRRGSRFLRRRRLLLRLLPRLSPSPYSVPKQHVL